MGALTRFSRRRVLAPLAILPFVVAGVRGQRAENLAASDAALWRAAQTSLFNKKAQRQVACASNLWKVVLGSWGSCGAGGATKRCFNFAITDKLNHRTSELQLRNETQQVDAISLADQSRAVILGRAAPNLNMITLVGLRNGKVIDSFYCVRPAISPGNRYLAYVKWFPTHLGYGTTISFEYLVYDLSASPEFNRPSANRGVSLNPFDVGWPVYPEHAQNTASDNVLEGSNAAAHQMASSGFFWLGATQRFAFLDSYRGKNTVVIADLSRGVSKAMVAAIPLHASRAVEMSACRSQIAPTDFERWARNPAILVRVESIQLCSAQARCLRLALLPRPCVVRKSLQVAVPGSAEWRAAPMRR